MARIVVAEDDPKQAELVRRYAVAAGHEVTLVPDGRAALDEVGRRLPDLLVLDVMMHDVGLLGHSRGGRGMMWAAANKHRDQVPDGVRFRAVFGLAAAGPPFMDHRARRLKVSRIPVMTWTGGCDATGDDSYNRLAQRGGDPVNIAISVDGANHNNLNSRWSAHSGLPGGEDDAMHPPGRPGKCHEDSDPSRLQDSLGYHAEQRVAAIYVRAFFARYLQGDKRYDDVLAGDRKPAHRLTRVDVRHYPPAED